MIGVCATGIMTKQSKGPSKMFSSKVDEDDFENLKTLLVYTTILGSSFTLSISTISIYLISKKQLSSIFAIVCKFIIWLTGKTSVASIINLIVLFVGGAILIVVAVDFKTNCKHISSDCYFCSSNLSNEDCALQAVTEEKDCWYYGIGYEYACENTTLWNTFASIGLLCGGVAEVFLTVISCMSCCGKKAGYEPVPAKSQLRFHTL